MPAATGTTERRLNRFELTKNLVGRLKNGEAVIGGIGNTNFDLWAAGQRPENFYMLGSMGLACPIALGVAIAQPDRRVIALEGDGSVLMQLGSLTTIGAQAPKNLTVVIMDNGCYQITGAQPTTTGLGTDIVTIAKGAGITQSSWARTQEEFGQLIDRALSGDGPWLIAAKIDNEPARATTERDPVRIRHRFMDALAR